MVEKDKKKYFDTLLTNDKDTATIWRAINSITNSSREKTNSQNIELDPDTINNFFLNLPNTLLTQEMRNASLNYECPLELINFCGQSSDHFYIPHLTILDVGKLISNLKKFKNSRTR